MNRPPKIQFLLEPKKLSKVLGGEEVKS